MTAFTLTCFTVHSPYCPQIIHTLSLLSLLLRLFVIVSGFFVPWLCVLSWSLCRTKKLLNRGKPTNKPRGPSCYLCYELIDERMQHDAVCSECTASQFCSVPWDSYALDSVVLRSRPKGVKLKTRRRKLKRSINRSGALREKVVK